MILFTSQSHYSAFFVLVSLLLLSSNPLKAELSTNIEPPICETGLDPQTIRQGEGVDGTTTQCKTTLIVKNDSHSNDEPKLVFQDSFQQEDGLISNEYAYWNEKYDIPVISSDSWLVSSGSFFVQNESGWTGIPSSCTPNEISSNCTNSNTFRLNTKQKFAGKTEVSFSLRQNQDSHNPNCKDNGTCWHGVHLWLRHQNQYNLYYASIQRADGKVVIKRKVPCGTDNKGTYITLSKYIPHNWTVGNWINYSVTIDTNADGFVQIDLYDESSNPIIPIASGIDRGGVNPQWHEICSTPGRYPSEDYTPIIEAGSVGIRGDYVDFNVRDFMVFSNEEAQ